MNGDNGNSNRPPRSPEAVVEDFKSVIASSIAGNMQVATRLRDLLRAAVETPSASARTTVRSNSRDDLAKILDFALASARILTTHSVDTLNRILDEVEADLLGRTTRPAASTEPPNATVTEIVLRGALGQRVTSGFLLDNNYDRSLNVSFEMGDLLAEGRSPIPGSEVQVEPTTITVPGKGQAVARIGVVIGSQFAPGASYFGQLRTVGIETGHIQVRIEVQAQSSAQPGAQITPENAAAPAQVPAQLKRRRGTRPAVSDR